MYTPCSPHIGAIKLYFENNSCVEITPTQIIIRTTELLTSYSNYPYWVKNKWVINSNLLRISTGMEALEFSKELWYSYGSVMLLAFPSKNAVHLLGELGVLNPGSYSFITKYFSSGFISP